MPVDLLAQPKDLLAEARQPIDLLDKTAPKRSFFDNLINIGLEVVKDIPAQIEDLMNIPAALLGTPRPAMKSKLTTETVPYIMEKATTPIGNIPIKTLSYNDVRNIASGRFTYTEAEISPSLVDIGWYGLMGASLARNQLALARWNNQLNKLIKTEEVRGAVMNNMESFEALMTQVGVKMEGMDLTAKTNFILNQAKSSPKLGTAIMDLVSGKIMPKAPVAGKPIETGIVAPAVAPKQPITAPIAPKVIPEGLPLAIRLKSGEIITDATAKLHSDIITSKGINPDDVADVGIMQKKVPTDMKFTREGDAVGKEYHETIYAIDPKTNKQMGFIKHSYLEGESSVQMIEVKPEYRKKGVGLALLNELQSQTEKPITLMGDVATKEGQALWKKFEAQKGITEGEYIPTKLPDEIGGMPFAEEIKKEIPVRHFEYEKMPMRLQDKLEPKGIYYAYHPSKDIIPELPPKAKSVKLSNIKFENPLIIPFENWKINISKQFGGLKGEALSKAIAKQGYDGIITIYKNEPHEIVDLTDFYNQVKGGAPLETLPKVPEEVLEKAKVSVSEKIGEQKEGIPSLQKLPIESKEVPLGLPSVESMTPESNPVKKIIEAIKKAENIRAKQETLYTQARAEKLAKMAAVGEKVSGQKGYYARLGALKGKLPKVEFESIVKELKQEDIDALFNMIKASPHLSEWDKLPAFEGLNNLLGQTGGKVPTETQIKFLHKVFGKEFTDTLLEKRPLFEKMKEAGLQILNIPRSIMASFDLSFGLRQGAFFAPRYRKEFMDSWTKQFKWFASEDAFKTAMQVVSENPNYNLAVESGVSFTEMDSLMTEREEIFASQWAEKIPVVGKGVHASARAYTAFANKLRMDSFSKLVQDAQALGLNPQKDRDLSKAIAEFVNNGTGRGSLGGFERSALALNAFFFSPRLMASRLNLLNPVYYINQNPFVRKQAIKTLLTFLGAGLSILTLAKLMGAKVGNDPRSSDFGKIKIKGITRIDIWGGFQPYIRMAGQMISGQYVSSTTGKVLTLGEGYKPLTRLDILQRQVESKEAPVFSFLTDILKGQTFEGKPINIPKEIGMRFIPMVVQDLYDVIKDNPEATPAVMLAPFGVGVQTYKGKRKVKF